MTSQLYLILIDIDVTIRSYFLISFSMTKKYDHELAYDFTPIKNMIEKENPKIDDVRAAINCLFERFRASNDYDRTDQHPDLAIFHDDWSRIRSEKYSVQSLLKQADTVERSLEFILRKGSAFIDPKTLTQVNNLLLPELEAAKRKIVIKAWKSSNHREGHENWTKPFFDFARELIQETLVDFEGNPNHAISQNYEHKKTINILMWLTEWAKSIGKKLDTSDYNFGEYLEENK